MTTDNLAAGAARAFSAYRGGDPAGMSDLVDLATGLLWHTARAQGLSRAQAEDVVQTTWLRLVENVDRIDDPQAVLKWLITTTRRAAWATSRIDRRAEPIDGSDLDLAVELTGEVPDLDQALLRGETQEVVWRHFRTLPERCRSLLRVVAFADRPDYARIAEAMGMKVGSIGPTRGRCLAKLRAALIADPAWALEA